MLSTRRFIRDSVKVTFLFHKDIYTTPRFNFTLSCHVRKQTEQKPQELPKPIYSPDNSQLLKVAIIGLPNSGKSTLINRLMEYDVCPVSKKPHTTRTTQRAIYLEDNVQVVFVDTPGVVNKKETKKFSLADEFVKGPEDSVRDADLIAVIHDVSNRIIRNKLDPRVIGVLQKFPTKSSILIVNKVDVLKIKRNLLESVYYLSEGVVNGAAIPLNRKKRIEPAINKDTLFRKTKERIEKRTAMYNSLSPSESSSDTETQAITPELCEEQHDRLDPYGRIVRGWPNFRDVFLISALTGDGVDLLRNYLKTNAKPSEWAYEDNILTDCPPASLCLRILKAKMLEHMKNEVPYIITPTLDYWDTDRTGTLQIIIGLVSPNVRLQKMIIGTKGDLLNAVTIETERNLSQLLQAPVKLTINVTMKSGRKPRSSKAV